MNDVVWAAISGGGASVLVALVTSAGTARKSDLKIEALEKAKVEQANQIVEQARRITHLEAELGRLRDKDSELERRAGLSSEDVRARAREEANNLLAPFRAELEVLKRDLAELRVARDRGHDNTAAVESLLQRLERGVSTLLEAQR
jgi:chromosome segregation ATPase